MKIEKNIQKTPTLLVFVDGLNYDVANDYLNFVNKNNSSVVTPGIGFSNNIYPEMLCGTNPDEIGYFNEWSPRNKGTKQTNSMLKFLDILRFNKYLNAGLRKIILKKIFKLDFANIPFRYVHLFKPQGSHQFRDLPDDSLLNKYNFEIYDAFETGLKRRIRDFKIIEDLEGSMLPQRNYFLSLLDLDHTSHVFGTRSIEVQDHLKVIEQKLKLIFEKFINLNPTGQIFLFSDHGMVDVNKGVRFDIEKHLGRMDVNKYLYFVDSTYARIWIKDNKIESQLVKYLKSRNYGKIVSQEERITHGLSNKEFGDYIFRANEGVMFVPNFYGGRINKAMHGYDSKLPSQKAIFVDVLDKYSSNKKPNNSKGIFSFLNESLQ